MKILKVKPGKEGVIQEWGKKLMTGYAQEAREALREENVSHEFFYLFKIGNDYYIAAHMEGDNIVPPNLNRELNRKHREVLKECVEEAVELEELYDIKI